MHNEPDVEIAALAASVERGSFVAAAGCGKTEQIARAVQLTEGRRLILTHTHAGVDVLRARLKRRQVPSNKFHIDTIAGWCLRYSASFPKRSGLTCLTPKDNKEWNTVYEAAVKLIKSGAVKGVLTSTYSGVFVDEYQDCTGLQHQVIQSIAGYLPVCVFGDPLQAIFDFKGQKPVDWNSDVFPVFIKTGEMNTPWRWAGNPHLGSWLANTRCILENDGVVDLTDRPKCVKWERLPDEPQFQRPKIIGVCKSVLGIAKDEGVIIIGDGANINLRTTLAQSLASVGFSNIEPLGAKQLYKFARDIEMATGSVRLQNVLEFICACMTGANRKPFLDAVTSHQGGGKKGAKEFGDLIGVGIAVAEGPFDKSVLELMQRFHGRAATRLYRREMFFAMCAALQNLFVRKYDSLTDAIWDVQNRSRHNGRLIGRRSIGSTLLVKGLEFEHSVIIHAANMTKRDWYVALTRATISVTILSPTEKFSPKD